MAKRDIIAIGGSAGSGPVLKRIVSELPADLPASIFVSTHLPPHSPSYLPDLLAGHSSLPVSQAIDGQPIERGRVYIAAPDRHLLLIDGRSGWGKAHGRTCFGPPLIRCSAPPPCFTDRAPWVSS